MSDVDNTEQEMPSIADALLEIPRRLSPEQKIVRERLFGRLDTELQPFEIDELSPTPLDPMNLYTVGINYVNSAEMFMQNRLDERIMELGIELGPGQYEALSLEIHTAHMLQVGHNAASLERLHALFLKDPTSITPEIADKIYLARLGASSVLSRLELLADNPEMESIEDMKFTKPLNAPEIKSSLNRYGKMLNELNKDKNGVQLRILPVSQQKIRLVDVSGSAKPGILVTKTTIAEATVRGVEMVLKKRDWYFAFPAAQNLGNVIPSFHVIDGERVNLQYSGVSTYWTTKESDEAEQTEDVTEEMSSDINVPQGYSKVAIGGLKKAA